MDIACPHCAATYRVPDALLAGGKALRCAACGHDWVPEGAAPAAEPPRAVPKPAPVPPAPVPRASVRPPAADAASSPPPGSGLLPAAWIASVAAVTLGVAVLVLFRAEIAAAWPPFGRLLGG
jgi:predicted Zn finger-like uncharacterized protein